MQGKVNNYAKMKSKYHKKGVCLVKTNKNSSAQILRTAILKFSEKKLFLNF